MSARRWRSVLLFSAILALPAALPQSETRSAKAEAQLREIRAEIDRVRGQVRRDAAERERLSRRLRDAEQSVAAARAERDRLRAERDERARRRAELAEERRRREADLEAERRALAAQMRAAYMIGREEPLKLLLNQRDPARAGRMFAYYGYFGRARAGQIVRIEEHVARIEELDAELEAEQARLADLETRQRSEVARAEEARAARGEVLAALNAEARSRAASLERLRREQAALEKLVRELRRALQKFPSDSRSPFGRMRGQLAWPVAGRIAARFGQTRAGGLRWEGVLVASERGAPVRAVYRGRVVYADWLAGLGLLVIVDHGGGYLSLYGHNDQIYRKVGETVAAGDSVGAVGDTGGRASPELYFEIRRGGRPVDPQPWFRTRTP
jgi:septal ring factor EnvC (AmiA/AmiB activator)